MSYHPESMYEIWKLLKTTQVIVSEPKCWQSSVLTVTVDFFTHKCIGIFLLPSCIYARNMKAAHWKTTQAIVSETKCWQSSVVTLTCYLLTPKCIGIFLSRSCSCTLISTQAIYHVRNNVLAKFICGLDLWFLTQMYRYLGLTILHLYMKYESCMLKTTQVFRVRT